MTDLDPFNEGQAAAKARRMRSLAIALVLAGFVILVFIVTLTRMGGHVADNAHLSATPDAPKSDAPKSGDVAKRANSRVVLYCLAVLVLMTAMGFAAVPLYRIFCQRTGFGGTVSRSTTGPTGVVLARALTVTFDTNVRGLPWVFKSEDASQTIKIGQTGLAFFTVANTSDKPLTGHAVYNVTPEQAGAYFHKLQCFCFTDQTIAPHTTMRFPVVYFVDPQFASDPDTKGFSDVTLSYTFFPAVKTQANAAKVDPGLGGRPQAAL